MATTAPTIEQLEIEIQASSASAVSGIDSLSTSLSKLKTAVKGGVGLRTVANQFNAFNTAMSNMDASAPGRISSLASSLEKLRNLGNIKLSSTLASGITAIGQAASSIGSTDFSSVEKLGTAMQSLSGISATGFASAAKSLSTLPKALESLAVVNMDEASANIQRLLSSLQSLNTFSADGFTSAVNALNKLPKVAETLSTLDLTTFTSNIQQLSNALAPLASQLDTVATAFAKLPSDLTKTVNATNKIALVNEKASKSYVNLWAKARMASNVLRTGASTIANWINSTNQYIEDINLFTVSMGEYASEAQAYAEQVGNALGINPGEFMRNQGVFDTIIEGFGVASDKAYLMSKNLTQLGYDISSFFNISTEDAMAKLQSGIAGELEPLRRIGYDLSVTRLQQEAYNLGINKSISAMTQAEKSQLRYYAIMTQVTDAQGDMARTLTAPSNQLRVLKAQVVQASQALGKIFIPVLNAVLPYAIAVAKVVRYLAEAIASFFGFTMPDVDFGNTGSTMSDLADGITDGSDAVSDLANNAGSASDNLGDATTAAKKLKNALLGIDELNVISQDSDSSSGSGLGNTGVGSDTGLGSGDLGIDLPTYDFLANAVSTRIDAIAEKMKAHLKDVAELVASIGAGFLAWNIAKGVLQFFQMLQSFKGFTSSGAFLGLTMLLSDMNEFKKYLDDFITNGASVKNVAGMITEFAGMLGDAFIILGNVKLGGALKVAQGASEIVIAFKDMVDSGVNWDNAMSAVRGISNIAIGLGLITGNLNAVGVGLVLQGVLKLLPQIKNVIKAIKTGDWSLVSWTDLVIGAVTAIGGIVVALGAFKGIGAIGQMKQASDAMGELVSTTNTTSDTVASLNGVSSGISSKLKTLAGNLLIGIAIIAEVAAAAIIIVGSIALLGVLLGKVADAWEPVIENAGTVATAMGIGVGTLAAVGAVTAILGSVGEGLVINLGVGIAMLVEISVATDIFIGEIALIGKLLDKVGQAWKPVISNAPAIKTGIKTGTALLVAIGGVTAALGVATVATAGTIPVAIGIGTALLVELAGATIAFCNSLSDVADEMNDRLHPSLLQLNTKLPTLTTNMSNFVDFMSGFAGEVVRYTKADAISGIASTVDKVIGFFTTDPIQKLSNETATQYNQLRTLVTNLNNAIPKAEEASELMSDFNAAVSKLGVASGADKNGFSSVKRSINISVSLTKDKWTSVAKWIGDIPVIKQSIALAKSGWSSVKAWIGTIYTLKQNISLGKSGWVSVKSWIGSLPAISQSVSLVKSGWKTVSNWVGSGTTKVGVSLYKYNYYSLSDYVGDRVYVGVYLYHAGGSVNSMLGLAGGGTISASGVVHAFANGGVITPSMWKAMPKYASGTRKPHGSMFVAGESGAELVGHVNGTTEVLNRFQLASVMQSAIVSGMSQFAGYWQSMSRDLVNCANGIINSVMVGTSGIDENLSLASATGYDPYNTLSQNVYDDASQSYKSDYTDEEWLRNMKSFYTEYVEPTLKNIATDTKRQADKEEKTVVQIDRRTLAQAVTAQQKASGYSFTG